MRIAALVERTPDGRWRAWAPALPGVEVTADTSSAAEENLAQALERHVRAQWAGAGFVTPPELRAFNVELRTRPDAPLRRPLERQAEDEKRRTLRRLDEVLSEGARLPSFVLDAVFRYRREVRDAMPDDVPPEEPEPGEELPENVVLFAPRER